MKHEAPLQIGVSTIDNRLATSASDFVSSPAIQSHIAELSAAHERLVPKSAHERQLAARQAAAVATQNCASKPPTPNVW